VVTYVGIAVGLKELVDDCRQGVECTQPATELQAQDLPKREREENKLSSVSVACWVPEEDLR
jgi:hypothetical protein